MRRRRSLLVVFLAVAIAAIVVVTQQSGGRTPQRVTYDRRAAATYADEWALRANPEYWTSPDNDCANFVSQCLAAGGLHPTWDADREWRSNGTEFPTVAWVNCGAQLRALSARATAHSKYYVSTTRTLPASWTAGDVVYLGNTVDGEVEWQHVIVCAGRQRGEWVYDSHTTAYRHRPLDVWYPEHFTQIRYCHIASVVSYAAEE